MLSIIVAFDKNQLIGKDNKMPWHYPEDLKYFKEVTWGKKVVMGSNTYQSILDYLHKPLPNRHNIVITSKKDKYPEIECYESIEHFLRQYHKSTEEIFIIGGKMIYEQFINLVDRLYITHIDKTFEGDTYFPHFDKEDFKIINKKSREELSFIIYERKVQDNE
ncbi:dihydrofolate reductase [Mycoplasmatota bacterium]|nr:dihydrofolate reductase [Mycoplasmatota bacterium]